MTIDEAVKRFANDFNEIPTALIIQAYKENPEYQRISALEL